MIYFLRFRTQASNFISIFESPNTSGAKSASNPGGDHGTNSPRQCVGLFLLPETKNRHGDEPCRSLKGEAMKQRVQSYSLSITASSSLALSLRDRVRQSPSVKWTNQTAGETNARLAGRVAAASGNSNGAACSRLIHGSETRVHPEKVSVPRVATRCHTRTKESNRVRRMRLISSPKGELSAILRHCPFDPIRHGCSIRQRRAYMRCTKPLVIKLRLLS